MSVVIPTYNRRQRLDQVLAGLADQDATDPFEVIVISDGSTDGTDDYLRGEQPPLEIVAACQPNAGPAAARNRGIELARGEIVLFIDDDVVPTPGLVAEHVAAHRAFGADAVVIGPMVEPAQSGASPWIQWEHRMLLKQYDAMQAGRYAATARQFYTGNASLRRAHLLAVGCFDPTFRRLEDVELAYRLDDLGLQWHFWPRAVGLHHAERTFESWHGIAYHYGRNDVIFGKDRGRVGVLDTMSKEYPTRSPLVRGLVRICVGHPGIASAVVGAVRVYATSGVGRRTRRLTRVALSSIYNVAYYQGVADELGGADRLRALLTGSQ